MDDIVTLIPVKQIRIAKIVLRKVLRRSPDYKELRASILKDGILNSILVRPVTDGYEIVDGSWRFDIAKSINLKEVPCIIKEMDDREAMILQVKANAIRPETHDIDYCLRAIELLGAMDVDISELAYTLGKSDSWVRQVLSLQRLNKEAKTELEKHNVSLTKRAAIAKLPKAKQSEWIEPAKEMSTAEFVTRTRDALKDYRDYIAAESEKEFTERHYVPLPAIRNLKVIVKEITENTSREAVLEAEQATTAIEGWNAALKWVMQMDCISYEKRSETLKDEFKIYMSMPEKRALDRELMNHWKKETFYD